MHTLATRAPDLALALSVFSGLIAAAPAAAQQDFSQVQIKTTKIAGNFYTLEGQGGTIGVLAGPDGVLMVDRLSEHRSRQRRHDEGHARGFRRRHQACPR
jgi:hypothetical protein